MFFSNKKVTKTFIMGLCILLLGLGNSYGQKAPEINKKGQYMNKIHVRFNDNQTNKLDKKLKGKNLLRVSNKGYITLNDNEVDFCNKKFKAYSIKRLFRPAGKFEKKHRQHGLHLWYEIEFNAKENIDDVVRAYQKTTAIEIAESVREIIFYDGYKKDKSKISIAKLTNQENEINLLVAPNDPNYNEQWHYKNTGQSPDAIAGNDINLEEAWKLETGSKQVIVAIEDTGFDVTHPDLKGNLWINEGEIPGNGIDDDNNGYIDDIHGYNFADDVGAIPAGKHGTHVAGTVAAETNNGIGVAGVAGGSGNNDGVLLMSNTVFGHKKAGFSEAFVYAADNGAVISQNSWGYGGVSASIRESDKAGIDYFIATAGGDKAPMNGGVVIFATGNNGVEGNFYPSRYEPVLSVSSVANSGKKASYSNYGTWVDISAPGGDQRTSGLTAGVLSTIPGGKYGYLQGTSMACPHASGVAALVVSKFKGKLEGNELKTIMENSTNSVDHLNANYKGKLGSGVIDALKALKYGDAQVVTPIKVRMEEVGALRAIVKWDKVTKALRYRVKYRKQRGNWKEVVINDTQLKIKGLTKNTSYELQVRAESLTKNSVYSQSVNFKTLDIEPPREVTITSIQASSIMVSWSKVENANEYSLRYRAIKTPNWETVEGITELTVPLTELSPNTFYVVQVKASKNNSSSIYSETTKFLTLDDGSGGCGGVPVWKSNETYGTSGTEVSYQGWIYVNKWWANSKDVPGLSSVWEKVRECSLINDNQLPTVEILTPQNGQVIEQETLTSIVLSAKASDADGIITKIIFEVNGVQLTEGNNINWTPEKFGNYTIQVTVTDDKGAIATAESKITIKQKVLGNQVPTVEITTLQDGQIIEQEILQAIILTANATDSDGTVESIQFSVNGVNLLEGNNVNWTPNDFGNYTIKVVATDDKGAIGLQEINATIKERRDENQPPQVTITNPINGQIIEQETLQSITLIANATDSDGTVESIQFSVNGANVSEGNNVNWTPTGFGNYTVKVVVVDNKGAMGVNEISITIKEKVQGGDCNGVPSWDATTEYKVKGIRVYHKGNIYESKWWTKNEEPGTGGPWGPWLLVKSCSVQNMNTQLLQDIQQDKEVEIEILEANLYTLTGKKIKTLSHKGQMINLEGVKQGLYILVAKTKKGDRIVRKISIQK
ncbi:S8 family serine peptidase [Tenacibaculum sp. 190524A02b]|uniref:S8 family serine peptidase n=2 Tax=Tenacibaculum vairaonense TaxID=3137860 RepID=A0ABM9PSC2_9FLAO